MTPSPSLALQKCARAVLVVAARRANRSEQAQSALAQVLAAIQALIVAEDPSAANLAAFAGVREGVTRRHPVEPVEAIESAAQPEPVIPSAAQPKRPIGRPVSARTHAILDLWARRWPARAIGQELGLTERAVWGVVKKARDRGDERATPRGAGGIILRTGRAA